MSFPSWLVTMVDLKDLEGIHTIYYIPIFGYIEQMINIGWNTVQMEHFILILKKLI